MSSLSNGVRPELPGDLRGRSALSFPLPLTSFSLCGQLKTSYSGDRAPLVRVIGRAPAFSRPVVWVVRFLWSPLTSLCQINHFLSERGLFDRANQEIPLYLPLISKLALPLNIKWWFWDDPGIGRATWWAEPVVIYCRRVFEWDRDPEHSAITQKTSSHTCATKISCHFTDKKKRRIPQCRAMRLYPVQ